MPKRIQCTPELLKNPPPNTIFIGRPSMFGNKRRVGSFSHTLGRKIKTIQEATMLYYLHNIQKKAHFRQTIREKLRGKDVMCWCDLDAACHGDVLLEIANREEAPRKWR